jgi:hypothetical protein
MRRLLPLILAVGLASASPLAAADGLTRCKMRFNLRGWSALYQTSSGTGWVHCRNGQSARVTLHGKGGGLTVGKTEITGGIGRFSGVRNIEEIYGTYARVEAQAAAVKSSAAEVLTKGEVSLALSGTGRGMGVGISVGAFTIERAGR